jgi:hypothetical protein
MARKKLAVPPLSPETRAPAETYPEAQFINPWPAPVGVALAKPLTPGKSGCPAYQVKVGLLVEDQYYTQAEVADLFRCSIKTLERWRKDGTGPKVSRFYDGARPLYLGAHLREAMEAAVEPRPVKGWI